MTSRPLVRQDAVGQLAARLSNTGQVLEAWALATGNADEMLARRLQRAVSELQAVVASLTVSDDEFLALESVAVRHGAGRESVPCPVDDGLGMRGRSEVISFIEFVAFISSLGKDGVLRVQTLDERFTLELRGGCVVHAAVDPEGPGCHLSQILLDRGALSPEELATGMKNARGGESLGETLLRQNLVTCDELAAALTQRTLWIFCAAHRVGAGFEFQFEENTRVVRAPDVRLGVSHLLLESARLLDESKRGQGKKEETPRAEDDLHLFRSRLEEVLEGEELTLPVLPDATGQLLALCWSDDFDADQLLECVHHDQALCAHLLRIANSAAYAPVTPISSVQLAITRLGLDKLREVALALTLKQMVFQLPGWEDVVRDLWRTAAITGGFGNAISKACGAGAARGSMGGLLLDVGKPIILNALYEIEREIEAELTHPMAAGLMEEYHLRVGPRLKDQWALPAWLTDVMRYHHDYAGAGEHVTEAMIGHLAVACAAWALAPEDEERERLAALPVCAALHLEKADVDSILSRAPRILVTAKLYF